MGTRFLILMGVFVAAVMLAFLVTSNLWLFPPIFLLPAGSFVILKLIRRTIFQRYWVCPSCGQPLPMNEKGYSFEMEYVSQCPHCGKILEQPPELERIEPEYSEPEKPLEPVHDLPAPSSKWPCILTGGITIAFVLFLFPLLFIPDGNEPLDMVGVGTGVVLLLFLLWFGLMLLFCRHTEPEETRQPVVLVRERTMVTVLGVIVWLFGFILVLMGVIVAGTPPFEADVPPLWLFPVFCSFCWECGCCWLGATGLWLCSGIILFCISAAGENGENLPQDRRLPCGLQSTNPSASWTKTEKSWPR